MATQLARTEPGDDSFKQSLANRAAQFAMVLPRHITPEKFQRTVVTAVQGDPELLTADRQSLFLACMKAAQDGLLPDKREAALVIFMESKKVGNEWVKTKKVQYLPMVFGLRKKILQSGEVADITAKVVYRRELEEGAFIYEEGSNAMLLHKPLYDLTEEDTQDANIICAYSMATFKDGSKSYEVMRRFEINKVQNVSQTGALYDRQGKPRTPTGPWRDWYPEQAKKTVMRRHSKSLPQSGDIILDREGDEYDSNASTLLHLDQRHPDAPERVALPRRGEQVDPETGEITATEDDAEVTAEVDRQTMARAENGGEADEDPRDALFIDLTERLQAATKLPEVKSIETEWLKHRAAMNDDQVADMEAEIAGAKKRVAKPEPAEVE